MKSTKKYSEINLSILYESCPIFKKYCQFNLWSEELGEYDKIKYCESYIFKYAQAFTERYLLQFFSPSLLAILQTSPSFVKFVKSGFIKHIDFHFLLLFQSNSFHYSSDSVEQIETFVEQYFQRYSKKPFEDELLKCIIRSVNELSPQSLNGFMDRRLTFFGRQELGFGRDSFFLGTSQNLQKNFITSYLVGPKKCKNSLAVLIAFTSLSEIFLDSSPRLLPKKVYKSLKKREKRLGILLTDFPSTLPCKSRRGWGLTFAGCIKNEQAHASFLESVFIKSSLKLHYLYNRNNLERDKRIRFSLNTGYKWCFYTLGEVNNHPQSYVPFMLLKGSKELSKDVHALLELFVDDSVENFIDIASHRTTNITSLPKSGLSKAGQLNFESLLKFFDKSFGEYSDKSQINLPKALFVLPQNHAL